MIHTLCENVSRIFARNRLNILIYHQVMDKPDPMRPYESHVEKFKWQMELVKKHYHPIGLIEACHLMKKGKLPANAVCITFDDGYVNNLTNAAPILRALGIPATVFIATEFINGSNMFNDRLIDLAGNNRLEVLDLEPISGGKLALNSLESRRDAAHKMIKMVKYLHFNQRQQKVNELYDKNGISDKPGKMMTAEQIVALSQTGIEIGAHTHDHPILASLSHDEQEKQIYESKSILEKITESEIEGFAYPNGKRNQDYSENSVEIVKKCGFKYAVSTEPGCSKRVDERFELRRFTPWDLEPSKFHLRMLRNSLGI